MGNVAGDGSSSACIKRRPPAVRTALMRSRDECAAPGVGHPADERRGAEASTQEKNIM